MVYVLNLFDENIPYIIGPILYSIIAYGLSYVIFKKDYIPQLSHDKYKTTPISQEQTESIFQRVLELVKEEEQFKNPEISLKTLSASLKVSPQILSLVINQMSATNFNGFINSFRIEAAKEMLKSDQFSNYSVASIAFEVGFNSISSFNAAFKKTTHTTPATFRNH